MAGIARTAGTEARITRKMAVTTSDAEAQKPRLKTDLGHEIRNLRKTKKMTLMECARRSGLSVGFISQVERGISVPSIKALQDLCHAIGVPIGWFFAADDSDASDSNAIVVRADRRRRIDYGNLGIVDELLTPSLTGQLELLYCRFEPGATSGDDPYRHEGEEAGVVVQGSLEMWIDERRYLLREGDSFNFKSMQPHRYRNASDGDTIVIWAITPPTFEAEKNKPLDLEIFPAGAAPPAGVKK
jgi:transcriptional regulator with XRE-family HTH domain